MSHIHDIFYYHLILRMSCSFLCIFFFNDPATTEIYTLSLHDALPIYRRCPSARRLRPRWRPPSWCWLPRSEEHTSELQSLRHLVCRLLLEKKKYSQIRMMKKSVSD